MKFSVLLAVYNKDNPLYLKDALLSIINQTCPPDEIVVVEDGPIPMDLETCIAEMQLIFSKLRNVRISVNHGLAYALNEGLKAISNEYVARMDADDIAKPERFEKQLQYMINHPNVDVCGSFIDEFEHTIDNIISLRTVPITHADIGKYMKTRCPLNHPTVIYKKSSVLKVGGYNNLLRVRQDYDLWIRMYAAGFTFANIAESLLYFRTASDLYKRRGGLKIIKYDISMHQTLYNYHLISFTRMLLNILIYGTVRLIPNTLRGFIYRNLLRAKQ